MQKIENEGILTK